MLKKTFWWCRGNGCSGCNGRGRLYYWRSPLGIVRGWKSRCNLWSRNGCSRCFKIIIEGKGGHAGIPHETVDSIAIGTQVVSQLQQIVSRLTNPLDSLVVSVTQFHAGTTHNVIPEQAEIEGTVRSLRHELREETEKELNRL